MPCWAGSDKAFVLAGLLEHLPSLSCSARLASCWCLSCGPQPGEGEAGGELLQVNSSVSQRLGGHAEHSSAPAPPQSALWPLKMRHANFTQFLSAPQSAAHQPQNQCAHTAATCRAHPPSARGSGREVFSAWLGLRAYERSCLSRCARGSNSPLSLNLTGVRQTWVQIPLCFLPAVGP